MENSIKSTISDSSANIQSDMNIQQDTPKHTQSVPGADSNNKSGIADVANAVVNGLGQPDAVPAVVKDAIRKFKVKVDGEELEIDEATLLSDYQTKRAADKRFQEAAKMRKQAEEVIRLLKTDPRAALKHPAIQADERALAEAILAEQLEEELLDPKDKQIKQLQRELKNKAETEAKAKAEQEAQQLSAAEAQYVESYQRDISAALTTAGIPITNATVRSMTGYLQNALEAGYDMQPAQVVDLVKQDYQKQLKELFSASDATTIAALLGEDGLKKVRGIDLARLKSPQQVTPTPPLESQGPTRQKAVERKQKVSDFFAELKKGLK